MQRFLAISCAFLAGVQTLGARVRDAVTFDGAPAAWFAPAREIADGLGLELSYDADSDLAFLGSLPLDHKRTAPSGERYVSLHELRRLGVSLQREQSITTLRFRGKSMSYRVRAKRVVVDKRTQTMKAFQGDRLVVWSRVDTGKVNASTPNGTFQAGAIKDAYHASSRYEDAPMPWAVQISGHVFAHGHRSVVGRAASHGCVRLPMATAEWFYRWIERGTPLTIRGKWVAPARNRTAVGTLKP